MKKMFVTGMILLGMNQMAWSMDVAEKEKQVKRYHESHKKDYLEVCCEFSISTLVKCCGAINTTLNSYKNK